MISLTPMLEILTSHKNMSTMKKIIVGIGIVLFLLTISTLVLYEKGICTIWGKDIRLFGYLTLGIMIFSEGFLNLIFFLEGKNKWFNLLMMFIVFVFGGLYIVLWFLNYFGKI